MNNIKKFFKNHKFSITIFSINSVLASLWILCLFLTDDYFNLSMSFPWLVYIFWLGTHQFKTEKNNINNPYWRMLNN